MNIQANIQAVVAGKLRTPFVSSLMARAVWDYAAAAQIIVDYLTGGTKLSFAEYMEAAADQDDVRFQLRAGLLQLREAQEQRHLIFDRDNYWFWHEFCGRNAHKLITLN